MTDEDYVAELRSYGMLSTNKAADRIEQLVATNKQLTAERDRLRGGIEYILDGYGLNAPDYRFPYGEEEADWITDHLIATLKGETP